MQKLFDEVSSLDTRCYSKFHLSEDLLMEHAAQGMASFIKGNFSNNEKVIIVVGSGNNGADGIALARLLHKTFEVYLYFVKKPRSQMALLQEKRASALNIPSIDELQECDILVDAIVGTGFQGEFSPELNAVLQTLNAAKAYKIACDVPSGLKQNGQCAQTTFEADISLTMGALKKSMFLDEAKDFVGKIEVIELGIAREIYEVPTNWQLLDLNDLALPLRKKKNAHKGSFGHLGIACGEKSGAAIMSALTALKFGAGLVTLVGFENEQTLALPYTLMYAHKLPKNTTAIACGMGLGLEFSDTELETLFDNTLPLVLDADIFYMPIIHTLLKRSNIVLTPHPKEFVLLLNAVNLANITVKELQENRFKYVELFCQTYPNAVLLLKGANVIIGEDKKFYINPHGSSKLAKGGSGDVLSGLIGALLAQGYSALNAALHASLAHTKLAQIYTGTDFSLTPRDLIEGIGKL
ncbi:NAD(P)H-hydrate dehydratase [Sulfurimonas sp.]|uniref:NAD(P)H-hydrate dehydratase n=1 Tax=Sulfurimonas sp. TaxID=2022749 RepID=UPI00262C990A|nr:NAD(P)H-hydrate dehydratase [Sulfurimonas sp.]